MQVKRLLGVVTAAAICAGGAPVPAAQAAAKTGRLTVSEFRLPDAKLDVLRDRWIDRILARYPRGSWAPMKMELNDADLKLMGLPSKRVLLSRSYEKPTIFNRRTGRAKTVEPGVLSFAGAGYFGIRPGAWILLLSGGGVGWCSAAHVYGAPGSYDISTAGHCGKSGDSATVIGLVGNRNPVLIDFGNFRRSTDGGLGRDHALIDIDPQWQNLVTPTMAFWGGPHGSFTKTGSLAGVTVSNQGRVTPYVNPDPFLAQQILHYGHGTGIGAGGTPRSGTSISWGTTHFMFFGAISPGDSGSGSNTLLGDTVGAHNEAAGINTHLYVDPLMRQGLGVMGGTRVTAVGTPADGQLVGYPAPAPLLP